MSFYGDNIRHAAPMLERRMHRAKVSLISAVMSMRNMPLLRLDVTVNPFERYKQDIAQP